jgi:hypothetical protein
VNRILHFGGVGVNSVVHLAGRPDWRVKKQTCVRCGVILPPSRDGLWLIGQAVEQIVGTARFTGTNDKPNCKVH